MKILLTKAAKVWHKAGDIVEVSPAEAGFLLSVKAAEIIKADGNIETPEAKTVKRQTRKKG